MKEPDAEAVELATRRRRALYRATHRGMKEMDLLLGAFARHNVDRFDAADLDAFEAILAVSDRQLYRWIAGFDDVPEDYRTPMMDALTRFRPIPGHN